jgi:glycosyltransferase involved in cell wall biosynthesis
MVNQSYLPRLGGAEKQLSAVCVSLRKRGYDPVVITRRYKDMAGFEIVDGTPVYRIFAPQPKPVAALFFIVCGFIKILKLKPDLIHAYELLSPTDLAISARNWLNVPLVVKVLRGGWMGDIYKLHHRRSGKTRINRLKKHVDAFITISREISEELIDEGIDKQRCRYIPNGVDISVYTPPDLLKKKEIREKLRLPRGFLLLYCGRLAPEKGLDWLISVWKQFIPGKNATLILAGSGEEEEKLKNLAGENVIFTGFINDPLLYYHAADAFVLPSSTEGLSNSMLEAMACGLPVIAANVGAAPEVITNGQTGLLVGPENSQELLDTLIFLYQNPELRLRIGTKGSNSINKNYPLEKTVSALVSLYSELLNKKGYQ